MDKINTKYKRLNERLTYNKAVIRSIYNNKYSLMSFCIYTLNKLRNRQI